MNAIEMISAKEFIRLLKEEDVVIVDVRSREEYAQKHVKKAVNIPLEQLKEKMNTLPADKKIIVYCQRGGSSMMAARELSQKGYRTGSLIGGMEALYS